MIVSGNLEQAALEVLAADPTSALVAGRVYYNSVTQIFRFYTGSAWKDLLTADDAAVVTAKDIDGGTASNSVRITIPKATKAALDALARKAATVVYASDENKVYYDNGSALVPVGTAISGQSQWDEINGGVGPQSLYSPTNFTLASALLINDMVIFGNLTLGANLNVYGDLFVSGQLICNGFTVTVDGDATVLGGASMSGDDKTHRIRGSLYSGGTWTCTNSSTTSPPVFSVGEDFVCLDVSTGLRKNVSMVGFAASGPLAPRGYALKVGGTLTAGLVDVSGGAIGTPTAGGPGGSLVVGSDAICDGILAVGLHGVGSGAGGAGGSVSVGGDLVVGISAVHDGDQCGVVTAGGNGVGGALGASGGTVTIGGLVHSTVGYGAGSATIKSKGGDSTISGVTGSGGAVSVGGGKVAVNSVGGSGFDRPGSGGSFTSRGPVSGDGIATFGGSGSVSGSFPGGSGGSVTIEGDCHGNVDAFGGSAVGASSGGAGGLVQITGSVVGNVTTSGGSTSSGSGTSQGGAGGNVIIAGTCVGSVNSSGGASSGTSTGKGGNGGSVTIGGDVSGDVTASAGSGSASSTTGGNGGAVSLSSRAFGSVVSVAGTAPAGTPGSAGTRTTTKMNAQSQSRLLSAATGLTTSVAANVTASGLTLTPGFWDIGAIVGFSSAASTSITELRASISVTSATMATADTQAVANASGELRMHRSMPASVPGAVQSSFEIPVHRVYVSTTTTFYLVAQALFTVSTLSAFGSIYATRA